MTIDVDTPTNAASTVGPQALLLRSHPTASNQAETLATVLHLPTAPTTAPEVTSRI